MFGKAGNVQKSPSLTWTAFDQGKKVKIVAFTDKAGSIHRVSVEPPKRTFWEKIKSWFFITPPIPSPRVIFLQNSVDAVRIIELVSQKIINEPHEPSESIEKMVQSLCDVATQKIQTTSLKNPKDMWMSLKDALLRVSDNKELADSIRAVMNEVHEKMQAQWHASDHSNWAQEENFFAFFNLASQAIEHPTHLLKENINPVSSEAQQFLFQLLKPLCSSVLGPEQVELVQKQLNSLSKAYENVPSSLEAINQAKRQLCNTICDAVLWKIPAVQNTEQYFQNLAQATRYMHMLHAEYLHAQPDDKRSIADQETWICREYCQKLIRDVDVSSLSEKDVQVLGRFFQEAYVITPPIPNMYENIAAAIQHVGPSVRKLGCQSLAGAMRDLLPEDITTQDWQRGLSQHLTVKETTVEGAGVAPLIANTPLKPQATDDERHRALFESFLPGSGASVMQCISRAQSNEFEKKKLPREIQRFFVGAGQRALAVQNSFVLLVLGPRGLAHKPHSSALDCQVFLQKDRLSNIQKSTIERTQSFNVCDSRGQGMFVYQMSVTTTMECIEGSQLKKKVVVATNLSLPEGQDLSQDHKKIFDQMCQVADRARYEEDIDEEMYEELDAAQGQCIEDQELSRPRADFVSFCQLQKAQENPLLSSEYKKAMKDAQDHFLQNLDTLCKDLSILNHPEQVVQLREFFRLCRQEPSSLTLEQQHIFEALSKVVESKLDSEESWADARMWSEPQKAAAVFQSINKKLANLETPLSPEAQKVLREYKTRLIANFEKVCSDAATFEDPSNLALLLKCTSALHRAINKYEKWIDFAAIRQRLLKTFEMKYAQLRPGKDFQKSLALLDVLDSLKKEPTLSDVERQTLEQVRSAYIQNWREESGHWSNGTIDASLVQLYALGHRLSLSAQDPEMKNLKKCFEMCIEDPLVSHKPHKAIEILKILQRKDDTTFSAIPGLSQALQAFTTCLIQKYEEEIKKPFPSMETFVHVLQFAKEAEDIVLDRKEQVLRMQQAILTQAMPRIEKAMRGEMDLMHPPRDTKQAQDFLSFVDQALRVSSPERHAKLLKMKTELDVYRQAADVVEKIAGHSQIDFESACNVQRKITAVLSQHPYSIVQEKLEEAARQLFKKIFEPELQAIQSLDGCGQSRLLTNRLGLLVQVLANFPLKDKELVASVLSKVKELFNSSALKQAQEEMLSVAGICASVAVGGPLVLRDYKMLINGFANILPFLQCTVQKSEKSAVTLQNFQRDPEAFCALLRHLRIPEEEMQKIEEVKQVADQIKLLKAYLHRRVQDSLTTPPVPLDDLRAFFDFFSCASQQIVEPCTTFIADDFKQSVSAQKTSVAIDLKKRKYEAILHVSETASLEKIQFTQKHIYDFEEIVEEGKASVHMMSVPANFTMNISYDQGKPPQVKFSTQCSSATIEQAKRSEVEGFTKRLQEYFRSTFDSNTPEHWKKCADVSEGCRILVKDLVQLNQSAVCFVDLNRMLSYLTLRVKGVDGKDKIILDPLKLQKWLASLHNEEQSAADRMEAQKNIEEGIYAMFQAFEEESSSIMDTFITGIQKKMENEASALPPQKRAARFWEYIYAALSEQRDKLPRQLLQFFVGGTQTAFGCFLHAPIIKNNFMLNGKELRSCDVTRDLQTGKMRITSTIQSEFYRLDLVSGTPIALFALPMTVQVDCDKADVSPPLSGIVVRMSAESIPGKESWNQLFKEQARPMYDYLQKNIRGSFP